MISRLSQTLPFVAYLINAANSTVFAQESLNHSSSINFASGNYVDSQLLSKQNSTGFKTDLNYGSWGGSIGLQNTHISMQPTTGVGEKTQENLLISAYKSQMPALIHGSFVYKLDAHRIQGSAQKSAINILAPEISWNSVEHPLKLTVNMAQSHYPDMPAVKQYGAAVGLGFNHLKNWIELRTYKIYNLTPNLAEQRNQTHGYEFRLTHLINDATFFQPNRITLGFERGEKTYHVDMVSQSIYNLPMLNKGGHNISAMWRINSRTNFTVQLSKTDYQYTLSQSGQANNFKLNNASSQIAYNWE